MQGLANINTDDSSWSGTPLSLPRIQGADCCGEIVATGEQVNLDRIGERVLVRSMQAVPDTGSGLNCVTFGSECNGGFAQYATTLASEAFTIQSHLSDVQLASFPCAYSTAENMIERVQVKAGQTVLITGASGGVGSAAVQLAKRRRANVIAVCGAEKIDLIKNLGADEVIKRGEDLIDRLGKNAIDTVIDLVAGAQWAQLLDLLRRGGNYAVAGAIAGPIVELDVRTLYLKDLSFFGCTWQPRLVFENLVRYIERGELKPLVAREYPLEQIATAQTDFINKKFVGKLVLIPPQ